MLMSLFVTLHVYSWISQTWTCNTCLILESTISTKIYSANFIVDLIAFDLISWLSKYLVDHSITHTVQSRCPESYN